jgi:hypothetical protein
MRKQSILAATALLSIAACSGDPPPPPSALLSAGVGSASNPIVAPGSVAGAAALPSAGVGAPNVTPVAALAGTNAIAGSAATPVMAPNPVAVPSAGASGGSPVNGAAGAAGGPDAIGSNLYDPATNELHAPAPADGVQISTKVFDLQPGEEKFACYHTEIPIDGEIDVHYYESKMAQGSHHFILYKNDRDTAPLGALDATGCLTGFQSWIYSSAQPHIDLKMPEGVAMALASRQRVMFDMHYINTTDHTLHAQVTLNVVLAKGTFQRAASLISYNTAIRVPARGTQTVGGDCTPGAGAKFFYMLTHTHRRGQLATITRVLANGQLGEQLVKSTDWEVPQEKKYLTEPYLTFQPGEKFHYSCDYQNDLNQVVTSGPSAATNEMCMAITYYFPASAGGTCL